MVLVPPSFGPVPTDLKATAVGAGVFNTLLAAVDAANLTEPVLMSPGPFTILAPTDEAFAKLPNGTIEALLADIPTLTNILKYHVLDGRVYAGDIYSLMNATALNGQTIDIYVDTMDWSIMLNNATKVCIMMLLLSLCSLVSFPLLNIILLARKWIPVVIFEL